MAHGFFLRCHRRRLVFLVPTKKGAVGGRLSRWVESLVSSGPGSPRAPVRIAAKPPIPAVRENKGGKRGTHDCKESSWRRAERQRSDGPTVRRTGRRDLSFDCHEDLSWRRVLDSLPDMLGWSVVEDLYARHSRSVFRRARGLLDSDDVAREVTHAVFERAARLGGIPPQPSSMAWLYRTTTQLC